MEEGESVGLARARFKLSGERASLEGITVVDTGSLMSIIDRDVAEVSGLARMGRTVRLTTLSGEEVLCDEMLAKVFELEDERSSTRGLPCANCQIT